MSTTPNAFGSLSADAYQSPGTQVLPPFAEETLGPDAAPPTPPRANTNEIGVAYNVDQAAIPPTQAAPDDYTPPAYPPNTFAVGYDPYKDGGGPAGTT